jgi:hypothetical protein
LTCVGDSGYHRAMKINVAYGPIWKSRQFDTDVDLKPPDLIGNPPVAGRFLGCDAEGFEWRQLIDAVCKGATKVNLLGRAYVIESLDSALNFRLRCVPTPDIAESGPANPPQ